MTTQQQDNIATTGNSETELISNAIRAAFTQCDSVQSVARSVVIACLANHITPSDLEKAIKWWRE